MISEIYGRNETTCRHSLFEFDYIVEYLGALEANSV